MVSEDSTSRVMVLPVRLDTPQSKYAGPQKHDMDVGIRLYKNLHLDGRFCLSNELNDGVVDEAKTDCEEALKRASLYIPLLSQRTKVCGWPVHRSQIRFKMK